ncbi:hypothetical protein AX15_001609 [Amanita polypyramis BW_CC]|nr:hypothetical protein AX15_001609 [Amanita polypyramis BW_CC]
MSTEKKEPSDGPLKPYSIYTRNEKWAIVSLISLAGLFSPLTANIYFPAIPAIATAFHKPTELINLTITVYMVFQGVAPMLWGTLSDIHGRRPIFAACLLVLSLSCVGLALVPTSAYWLLMLLRCVQAAGSASTIALGAGVIGDISTREERGGFYGLFSFGPMVGPAIGPVLGGILSDYLGWRSIFWFLCIASSACLVAMILILPETLRTLVGDGSIVPPALYRPILPVIGRKHHPVEIPRQSTKIARNPFRLFTQIDILGLLCINAIINTNLYAVLATISTLLKQTYPFLNETTIGLCFLCVGGGMISGGLVTGKILDREYQNFKRKMDRQARTDTEKRDLEEVTTREDTFPLEKARLRLLPFLLLLSAGMCAGYGWCLEKGANLAGPLILQFFVGFIAITVMNSTSTLMIDLVPAQGSSITACSNLVRCTFAAVFVSVIQLIIDRISTGWTYIIFAGITLLGIPMVYFVISTGPSCRAKRSQK